MKAFVPGEIYRASDVNDFCVNVRFVKKAADETRSNTTLQNDAHLFLSVAANATYLLTGLIVMHGLNSDFELDWTVPSGTTMAGMQSGLWGAHQTSSLAANPFTESDQRAGSPSKKNSSTLMTAIHLNALVFVAGTAGTLQLRTAGDSTGTVTYTTASYLCLRRVD